MENARIISETLTRLGIWFTGRHNSPYIWLKCPNNLSSWQFFDYLLEKANIVGTPGAGFGANGEGFFRLTAFCDRENAVKAMERLKKIFWKRANQQWIFLLLTLLIYGNIMIVNKGVYRLPYMRLGGGRLLCNQKELAYVIYFKVLNRQNWKQWSWISSGGNGILTSLQPYIDAVPNMKKRAFERIVEPERIVMFRVPWLTRVKFRWTRVPFSSTALSVRIRRSAVYQASALAL